VEVAVLAANLMIPEPPIGPGPGLDLTNEEKLVYMRRVTGWFYFWATQLGNHPFIEFTGVMNEYIRCCAEAHKMGVDYPNCNRHTGKALPMPAYSVNYLNEKLECIFEGASFVNTLESANEPGCALSTKRGIGGHAQKTPKHPGSGAATNASRCGRKRSKRNASPTAVT
jgi:hypothetical protein